MKRKLVAFLMVTAITVPQAGLAVQASGQTVSQEETKAEQTVLQENVGERVSERADIFNVDFSDGAKDLSPLQNELGKTVGNPKIEMSEELHKNIVKFDGNSAYLYPFNQEKYGKINQNVTMECMVKFDSIPSGEHDIFSNQQSGGIGLGLNNGKLTFFAHVGGAYRQPEATVKAGQWYHIVGVVDGKDVKLYVNGELASENTEAQTGGISYPSSEQAWNMVLGGDSSISGSAESMIHGDLSFARLYSTALNEEEISELNTEAFAGADIEKPQPQQIGLGFAASEGTALDGEWNLNIHANEKTNGSVDKIEYDIVYDPAYLEYESDQHTMDGVSIEKQGEGRLHIISSAALSTDDFRNFGTTRLSKLNFRTKSGGQTVIKTENFKAYAGNEEVTDTQKIQPEAETTVQIYGKDQLDFNGDGVIGAGDVALADENMKQATAQEAAIYPYKHVVILTVDGSGQVWNPDAIYYAENNSVLPVKRTEPEIMAKRKNKYAMDLFNKEFATSYSAQAVSPAISAQNYSSILHGVPWKDVPSDYQVTNTTAGEVYYADYGKETPSYPSLFKAVSKAFPARHNAAFAEWTQILNGIIEPDAQVFGKGSASKESFYDVADYIRSDEFKNTAVVYMQSDWQDHVGHSTGFYNDTYWSELKQYDDYYKAVVDALKETGQYDDTLIIANADHGGSGTDHGSEDPSNKDIYIGVGGQTVDSGKRLSGGTNADISPIALAALRIEKPASMTGEVFDESAFLPQTELNKKNRDIEKVTLERDADKALLTLDNKKEETRVVDAVIDLNGKEVEKIDAKGGEVLREETENGKLKLTISYSEQPDEIAELTFKGGENAQAELSEVMLGTAEGKEIYPDAANAEGDFSDENGSGTQTPNGGESDTQTPEDNEGQDMSGIGNNTQTSTNNTVSKPENSEKKETVKTGDRAPMAEAAAGITMSMAAILYLLNKKRRR